MHKSADKCVSAGGVPPVAGAGTELSMVFYKISLGLIQSNREAQLRIDVFTQPIPDDHRNIFGSGVELTEFLRIQIQVPMIKGIENLTFDKVAQQLHIIHVARFRVGVAGQPYDQLVVVAMIVGVVAFAEHALVFLLAPSGIVQAVRGVKVLFAADSYRHRRDKLGKVGFVLTAK